MHFPNGPSVPILQPAYSHLTVAFNDFVDASARYAVGDVMVERGYVPQSSMMRDVFIRPPHTSPYSSQPTSPVITGNSNRSSPMAPLSLSESASGSSSGDRARTLSGVVDTTISGAAVVQPVPEVQAGLTSASPPRSPTGTFRTLGERTERLLLTRGLDTPRRAEKRSLRESNVTMESV